jgi:D-tyrosyl-tRNA(Tyr) deacylase
MRIVLQRVHNARVEVDGQCVGSIGKGYAVFLGIGADDTQATAEKAVDKIARLRIFSDKDGKTNLCAKDVGGEILVLSQFTLMADLTSNRPSFSRAASPASAKELYEYFITQCAGKFGAVASGRFGADMRVLSDNDGPFTLVLEF